MHSRIQLLTTIKGLSEAKVEELIIYLFETSSLHFEGVEKAIDLLALRLKYLLSFNLGVRVTLLIYGGFELIKVSIDFTTYYW
jgi:hypothetical protein